MNEVFQIVIHVTSSSLFYALHILYPRYTRVTLNNPNYTRYLTYFTQEHLYLPIHNPHPAAKTNTVSRLYFPQPLLPFRSFPFPVPTQHPGLMQAPYPKPAIQSKAPATNYRRDATQRNVRACSHPFWIGGSVEAFSVRRGRRRAKEARMRAASSCTC